jgi:primosomal protein N' (replication factor Y) (superfamily II helicase)
VPEVTERPQGTRAPSAGAAGRPKRRASARPAPEPAQRQPVARVAVDVSLAHLDRPFDYLVPERMDEAAVPGCRVRVRFSGQLVDGFLLSREDASDHQGRLSYLERVVSPEPVLTPEIAGLARAVADRYAGTLADVLRLAIPPRHATVESRTAGTGPRAAGAGSRAAGTGDRGTGDGDGPGLGGVARPQAGPWARYPAGEAFLAALASGRAPRAAWSALPGPHWAAEIALAAATALSAGRGAVIVVPDTKDLDQLDQALHELLGEGQHVCLAAGLGPAERYRRWLAVLRGEVKVVAGLRAAMFAPVRDLGLVVVWDDGDDLHEERRAPYPHTRDVLALRAHRDRAAALIGGFVRTVETTQLVDTGWARPIVADRPVVRSFAPAIRGTGDDAELARDGAAAAARLPSLALRTAREALSSGPVLVQVPRRGYLAAVACGRCREQARCAACGGPLAMAAADAAPQCPWCGALAAPWRCAHCGFTGLRSLGTGTARTAEELGRAFPAVAVRTSYGQSVLTSVPAAPAIVVCTPGAEPAAAGGYAAALLLDGRALLGRASLRAAEEALRRWLNAAALVRPASAGGKVIVMADSSLLPVQALVRWDPVSFSEREHAEREHLRFPPSVRMAAATGSRAAVAELIDVAQLPDGADILGPVPTGPQPDDDTEDDGDVRAFFRVPRARGADLAHALQAAQGVRSSRKAAGPVRVQMDPLELV